KLALRLLDRAYEAMAAAVASAVNLLDVEAVVLGGGMGIRFGEVARARLEKQMLPHTFNDDRPPAVVLASLGDLGGALGAAFLLTFGSLADLVGRRLVFICGLTVFSLASLWCGLSGSPLELNIARAVQGTGAAGMLACAQALIAGAFPPAERGTAFGIFGGTI